MPRFRATGSSTRDFRMRILIAAVLAWWLPTAAASANDCWVAQNFEGQSASSDIDFSFSPDTFADGMLICFHEETGSVTGNDTRLVRFGNSTLIGWAENGHGLEVVNTYQLDRQRRKLLMTQSRIGTATHVGILPDFAATFVADVVKVPN
jgi:hypothetical protein